MLTHRLALMRRTCMSTRSSCYTTLYLRHYLSSRWVVSSLLLFCFHLVTNSIQAFDQDINARAAMAFPQLYIRGIRGLEYTRTKFWLYMLDGLYQSAVVFYVPYLAWTVGSAISWNGRTIESLSDFGTTVAAAAIVTANSYVGLNTN
jgi:magnesium-transporting ATPase (P-type)